MRISDLSSDVCSSDLRSARERRAVHDRDGAPVALYLATKASVRAQRPDALAVRDRSPARTVDPLYAADRAGAGTLGSVRRMDSVLGVGAATESRIRFSWRAARHDGSADRRRVAGDHRAPLRRAVRGAQGAAERVLRPDAAKIGRSHVRFPFYCRVESRFLPDPGTRQTPQIGPGPERSEGCDECIVFWALAQRLRLEFDCLVVPLDITVPPTEDELLAIIARHSVVPFEELKQQPRGCFDHTPQFAAPADPAAAGRFVTMPDDVRTEMTELAGEHFDPAATFSGGQRFTHRLASRRMRNRFN